MSGLTITEAMDAPELFGDWFAGGSWDTWRSILRAAYHLPMTAADRTRFRAVAGDRKPPARRVKELWAIAGRRSGKDSVASLVAAHAALFGDYSMLRPGERGSVICIAVDKMQAAIVQRYIAGYFASIPALQALVTRDTEGVLELSNGTEIITATNSFRSVRGKTTAVAIFDEACFFRDEYSANPDKELYSAILPSMATIPHSMLIGISTPYRRAGLLYEKWQRHYGKDDDDILVVAGPSRTFNPSLPQRLIDAELARDPVAARSEWLAQWRDDVGSWLSRDLILGAVDQGVAVRPPERRHRYFGFADPSGGRHDGFACAIAHAEDGRVLLDALFEQQAPFNPSEVVAQIAALVKQYWLMSVAGDSFGNEWVVESFARHGIQYTKSELNRSELYLNCLPLLASGRARLLDNDRMVRQFLALERRTQPGGHDRVDHPDRTGHHDDLSNAAAGALVLAGGKVDTVTQWVRAFGTGAPAAVPAASPEPAPKPAEPLPEPRPALTAVQRDARCTVMTPIPGTEKEAA